MQRTLAPSPTPALGSTASQHFNQMANSTALAPFRRTPGATRLLEQPLGHVVAAWSKHWPVRPNIVDSSDMALQSERQTGSCLLTWSRLVYLRVDKFLCRIQRITGVGMSCTVVCTRWRPLQCRNPTLLGTMLGAWRCFLRTRRRRSILALWIVGRYVHYSLKRGCVSRLAKHCLH